MTLLIFVRKWKRLREGQAQEVEEAEGVEEEVEQEEANEKSIWVRTFMNCVENLLVSKISNMYRKPSIKIQITKQKSFKVNKGGQI